MALEEELTCNNATQYALCGPNATSPILGWVESETNTFNTTCLFLHVRRMFDQNKLNSMHRPFNLHTTLLAQIQMQALFFIIE